MPYYHGTSKKTAAQGIVKSGGLDPAATEVKYADSKNSALKPAGGKVYITKNVGYAAMYVIGGALAGTDYYTSRPPKEGDEYGFMFVFDDKKVKDELMSPDEDSIGEILHYYWMKETDISDYDISKQHTETEWFRSFVYLANKHLTEPQIRNLKNRYCEYQWYAKAGKKLMPFLTPEITKGLVGMGAHIAHEGKLSYSKVYSFDKRLTNKLAKDGSNFFKLAKLVRKGSPLLEQANQTFKEFLRG